MTQAIPRALVALLIFVAAAYALVCVHNNSYMDGFKDGGSAVASAVDHSERYSADGDVSRMEPYTCKINDRSTNFSNALGVCVNSTWNQTYYVEDLGGNDGRGVSRSIPIRGKYHYGCIGYGKGGCSSASTH